MSFDMVFLFITFYNPMAQEIKEMNKSIKELSEAVKTLQQIVLTKADLPAEVSFKFAY